MPSSTNYWMGFAGLAYLVAGILMLRRELGGARGVDKIVALGGVFIAASLAAFAPEHFKGPEFVQGVVPSWMPARFIWPDFIGCVLLAAATSLALGRCVRLSSTLLGLMFFLFVCTIYAPSVLAHPTSRFAWANALRDLSFSAGAWALASMHWRAPSPLLSRGLLLFARVVLGIAAIYYAAEHFLHPEFAPGVPLEKVMPAWIPFPRAWGCLAGAVFLAAGICLVLDKGSRLAAALIGALMTFLTVFPYVLILVHSRGGTVSDINEALNYIADTLLYAGSALAVAAALPGGRQSGQT